MINAKKVSKDYRYRGAVIRVLSDVNLQVERGEVLLLRMPSGTGKSTLLNIIGGMLTPTEGSIVIDGEDIARLPQRLLSNYRRHKIGFVFQQFNLIGGFSVMENLLLPLIPEGGRLREAEKYASKLLERVGMSHRASFDVMLLSGGEQQRVALARALMGAPDVIIADEPFSNLDPGNVSLIFDIFREQKERGCTFLLSATSPLPEEGRGFVDREVLQW